MKNRLRQAITCLTIAAAATIGASLATDLTAAPNDTTWGAPVTIPDLPATPDTDGILTPLDTTWG